MVISSTVIICLMLIPIALIVIGMCYVLSNTNREKRKKDLEERVKKINEELSLNDMKHGAKLLAYINANKTVQSFGTKFSTKSTEVLFRKSKNPWHLTPGTYNFIRFGGLFLFIIIGLILFLVAGLGPAIIGFVFGVCCFILPQSKYEGVANKRETQWNQLYQFMWIIKNNISFYDPKRTFLETEKYISDHNQSLDELKEGFHDFANHWNGKYADDYIMKTYYDFAIPKQLFEIMLTAQTTGESVENELNSLRTVIINEMDYHVQDVLSKVSMKATLYSTPFVLLSVSIVVLVPVLLSLANNFL